MSDQPYILEARGLTKSYGQGAARVDVLRGVELAVRPGEFLAIMGPSGCGKSTLLHVLGLITPPDAGELAIAGQAVGRGEAQRHRLRRRNIGIVFQRFNLLGVLSAAENIEVSLRVRGIRPDGQAQRLLELLNVAHVARRKPSAMSIGEQQRVAVVRALAHEPDLLLADEPTVNLDSDNSRTLLSHLRDIHRTRGQTIIMITHSTEAAGYAQRVLTMRDGRIDEGR